MYIEEVNVGEVKMKSREDQLCVDLCCNNSSSIVVLDTKRVLVGAGACALFYPTLLYNVVRNKIQSEFRWWDRIDELILLGVVPFPADVPRLKDLGVSIVITLNEPYETLVPTSLYHAHNIDHLVIPTRDYLFAPSFADTCRAIDFIHENEFFGKITYVHCKAGRGRSTTIVLCYLVKHRQMMPDAAFEYVRSIRPRVLLASSQWQAVQDYYLLQGKNSVSHGCLKSVVRKPLGLPTKWNLVAFDDASMVVVTESDLDGFDTSHESGVAGNKILAELSLACRVQFASQAAIARISCLWFRGHTKKKLGSSMGADHDNTSHESSISHHCSNNILTNSTSALNHFK